MKTITFEDFSRKLSYGDYTAFVYNDGTQQMYCGCRIDDDSIRSFEEGGIISICNMSELPDIKEIMQENLLAEFEPADGIIDEGYEYLKNEFANNNGDIAYVDDGGYITYMLVW